MSEQLTLPAEARDRAGKGASRALRREGRVPAVVYGDKKEPLSVHVDFLRIGEHSQVNVNVPVRFDNEEASPGLKRGGVLNIVQHDLALVCDAAHIPDEIHIDLTGLEIGDSIHISQVKLPKGSKPANADDDFTVATIVAPSAMKQTEEEAAPEGEVPTVGEEEGEGEAEGGEAEGGDEA